jgi:xanthine/CO dehydrogenase XdhC/CoxF family maturation factor
MMEQQNDIPELASKWFDEGRKVALATVVATWGSSPRPCGSQLVVDDKSEFFGSVSGGCVEGAVISEAQQVMQTMQPKLLEFSVSNEMAWDVGLACGGTVKIYVEPVVVED